MCIQKRVFFVLFHNCSQRMAISKSKKKSLIEQYVSDLGAASNAVIVQQSGVWVTTATAVRKTIKAANGRYVVVRKRLFLRAIKEAGLPEVSMDDVPGSILLITANSQEDEFGPLKAVNKALKELKKADAWSSYTFLGWRFEKVWKDGNYVNDLANVPSKEELISKLMFLLKYPMQSLASVADQIAKKDGEVAPAKEESAPAPVAEQAEAPVAEVAEPAQEEPVITEEASEAPVAEETAPEVTDAVESTPTE